MALVPFAYNFKSLFVRRSATVLTVLGIGATVAVVAGVLALKQGFERLFSETGRPDLVVFLRHGAENEGESIFTRERAQVVIKSIPEIATDEHGQPIAASETYIAVRRFKQDGGETNVPVRGIQPASLRIAGSDLRVIEGRMLEFGSDEVVVGSKLPGRIRDCRVGDVIVFNMIPFRVVGVFETEGPATSEIWGDVERIGVALNRPMFSRVLARLRPEVDVAAFAERMDTDVQTPSKVMTEREYLTSQTNYLSFTLGFVGSLLAVIMGIAAVFASTNTMLAALAARTHEIGILLSVGFRPYAIFLAFQLEALLLGLIGGAVGCLLALPLNGVETGAGNFQTFTEVAFAFRVTPEVLGTAVVFSLVLGLFGGAVPAWRAARLTPTEALRRQ